MENQGKVNEAVKGDKSLEKGRQPTIQNKPDKKRVTTVAPDNDSGKPGKPAAKSSSNKGQGPAGENL